MPVSSPKIDPRSYDTLVEQTEALAEAYTQNLPGGQGWKRSSEPDAGSALVRIFSRMVHHAVGRLNQVPDKHLLVFLNLIGADPRPPRPARVPLTFTLAEGSSADAIVPAGTPVAAPPAEGEENEVVFETALELVVTQARLLFVLVHQPGRDRMSDRTAEALIAAEDVTFYEAFEGDQPTERSLYLACERIFTLPAQTATTLTIRLSSTQSLPVTWSYWSGEHWKTLPVQSDVTSAGAIRTVSFLLPADMAACDVHGREARWIRAQPVLFWSREAGVPAILGTEMSARMNGSKIVPDPGFSSGRLLDLSMDFYPLGEQPKFNEVFYLGSAEVFSKPRARVYLKSILSAKREALKSTDKPVLVWEISSGSRWIELGRSAWNDDIVGTANPYDFHDNTKAFTVTSPDTSAEIKTDTAGVVTFTVPDAAAPTELYGIESYWLRARLVDGHYGLGVYFKARSDTDATLVAVDDGFRPPIVKSVELSYSYAPARSADARFTYNDFQFVDRTEDTPSGFVPFPAAPADADPALYLGFDRPFESRSAMLYVQVAVPLPDESSARAEAAAHPAQVVWEYSSPAGWTNLGARDETTSFHRSGLVRFITPEDWIERDELDRRGYWLRARWDQGKFAAVPRLGHILINTVWANQVSTLSHESLGSSDDSPGQVFTTAESPILDAEHIDVAEPQMPPEAERVEIERLEGTDAITVVTGDQDEVEDIWVRWHRVADFYGSGPTDRHYLLDRRTGEVRFGDGLHGKVPPRGTSNIRVSYRIGGGSKGNRPLGTITELKTTVPYVESVTNLEPSSGGAEAEELESVKARGPRTLRHGHRAVTAEDFEDLVREASPAVARVRAIPPHFDPIDEQNKYEAAHKENPTPHTTIDDAGRVLLLIVPNTDDVRPTPGLGLLNDIESYIKARCSPAVLLDLSGPEWVEVGVTVDVAAAVLEGVDALQIAVVRTIERFLHPLTGGPEGAGWDFGRLPHASDLYPLLGAIRGVDHIRSLKILATRPGEPSPFYKSMTGTASGPPDGIPLSDESAMGEDLQGILIFSGAHDVRVISPGEGG